jgi:hypothetical protein
VSEISSLWDAARREAEAWLEDFRESANPQTTQERWEYLDQAAVHIEKLVNGGATFDD